MTEAMIVITEPVTIRSWISGGKGGFGYSSSQIHRLTTRRASGDMTACGARLTGKNIAVKPGQPTAKDTEKYGVCRKCWPVG